MKGEGEKTWTDGLLPEIAPDVMTNILARVADLALILSPEGDVLRGLRNPNSKIRVDPAIWEGDPLSKHLTVESRAKFEERLPAFLADPDGPVRPLELNHPATASLEEAPVRYGLHQIGREDAILMLGQDLRPVAEMQQQLVAAQIALETDYEAQREHDARLRVLMSATREGMVFVNSASGEVVDANAAAMALFGRSKGEMLGARLQELFDLPEGVSAVDTLVRLGGDPGDAAVTWPAHNGNRLSVRPNPFRASGEQMLLCQVTPPEGTPPRAAGGDSHWGGLFEKGTDAIVFMNRTGTVLSANNAFLRMTNTLHAQAMRGRNMADLLARGTVDLNVMVENTQRTGAMRLYATRILAEHGSEVPVEISTTLLGADEERVIALVLRDASRAEIARPATQGLTDVDTRSVVELIGSQNLKSIVAKTTDVIEKMCIETAVELTSNNRVAAAEMLGLSRQSLYVKLRKYDLLKKEQDD